MTKLLKTYKYIEYIDKSLDGIEYKYKIGITACRLAMYERSCYFDNPDILSFPSILKEQPEFCYQSFFDTKRSVSNVHRMASLINCLGQVKHLCDRGFDIVECGAGPDQSSKYISKFLDRINFRGTFHIFDTFEGHIDDTYIGKSNFKVNYSDFCRLFARYPFINTVKGSVPDSFNGQQLTNLCFINLDMNLYKPTSSALHELWPKLLQGGIVHVDDYNIRPWPGVTEAIDEFLNSLHPASFFKYDLPLGGCFLIKFSP